MQHFDCDAKEMREREYQPTRTPFPIWTFNEDYYTATRGAQPPKAHRDWPSESWVEEDSIVTRLHGNRIWRYSPAPEEGEP